MLFVAKALVMLVAVFFLVLGATALLHPAIARGFLLGFASTALKHYAELLARIIVGAAFLLIAPESPFSTALSGFGWLLVGTTALMALVSWRLHRRFAQFVVPKALRFLPLIGGASMVFGGLLLWVTVASNPA